MPPLPAIQTAPAATAVAPVQARLPQPAWPRSAGDALRRHWPEYAIEAWALGMFMLSACVFGVLLEYPGSPARQAISSDAARRALAGLAMGLTAVALIYSPWGKRSGAHMNPAFTLAFRRLGRIGGWDTLFYICAHFAGGALGVAASALLLGAALAHPRVNYAVTVPGPAGVAAAALAEFLISAGLMAMVLHAAASPRLERLTGLFAGLLIALYILFEAPLSGMSMNPARSFGSAIVADLWPSFWLYLVAPPLGMLAAAEFHLQRRRPAACAKFHHANSQRCIFCGAHGGF